MNFPTLYLLFEETISIDLAPEFWSSSYNRIHIKRR